MPRASREIWLVPLLVVGPLLLALAYSVVATSIYSPRNLITVLPYLCVLAAIGVAALPRRAMLAVATLGILAALLGSVRMVVDYPRPDVRAAAEYVEDRAAPGTPVIEPLNPVFSRKPQLAQDLAIHLDDRYPLSHDLKDLKRRLRRQPRGEDVYVVMPNPNLLRPVAQAVQEAGAEVNTARQFDGLNDVLVRSYRRK